VYLSAALPDVPSAVVIREVTSGVNSPDTGECYAPWPERHAFARGYLEMWVNADRFNPYWGIALRSDRVLVTVNPVLPTADTVVSRVDWAAKHAIEERLQLARLRAKVDRLQRARIHNLECRNLLQQDRTTRAEFPQEPGPPPTTGV
jgi:hypothetical protein